MKTPKGSSAKKLGRESRPTPATKQKSKKSGTPLQRFTSNFYAVPLYVTSLLSTEVFVKYLFVKEKAVSIEEQMTTASLERTLIVVNISADDNESTLRALFGRIILGKDSVNDSEIRVEIGKDRLALVTFTDVPEELDSKLSAYSRRMS